MTEEKAGGYISNITFNDGTNVNIQRDDIVIFVGPNNAGKSQALRDVYNLSSRGSRGIVVRNIKIKKENPSVYNLLEKISVGESDGSNITYHILGEPIIYSNRFRRYLL